MSVLDKSHFDDESAAYRFVEARVWPNGPICPHCGATEEHIGKLQGKSTRPGVYKCYGCRKPFTVKVGTIFESSHIKLHIWLQAMFLLCSSKKGISANQLARILGVTLKSAWFMAHRVREAMKADDAGGSFGGEGKVIEADETYFGPRDYRLDKKTGQWKSKQGPGGKAKVLALVERGGKVRTLKVEKMTSDNVRSFLTKHVKPGAELMTDESGLYAGVGSWAFGHFKRHRSVIHSAGEYVRYEKDGVV